MVIPIILGSDKTTVSVGTGNNEYWPVYLSIGNIHNKLRRSHRDGLVLLGFLPIPKGEPLMARIEAPQFAYRRCTIQLTNNMPMIGNSAASGDNFFMAALPKCLAALSPP